MPITPTKKKKNGLTQYLVRINYTDQYGEYRQTQRTVYGKAEAVEMERKLLAEVRQIPERRMTVAELCELFLKVKSGVIRDSTLEQYRTTARNHILPTLGDTTLDKFTVAVADTWRATLVSKKLCKSTMRLIFARLNTILGFAKKRGLINHNPLDNIDIVKSDKKHQMDNIRYYTPDQFRAYIAIARDTSINSDDYTDRAAYVFFATAYYTGMRKGEINGLRWSDIEGNIIHVRHQIGDAPPKTDASYRDIQMPLPLIEILDEQRAYQRQDRKYTDEYLVCGAVKPLSTSTLRKRNRDYAKTAHLPELTIHEFRHSHASLLANEGINIQEIARRPGHSNVQMTWNTYSHLYPREEERAVSILNNIR